VGVLTWLELEDLPDEVNERFRKNKEKDNKEIHASIEGLLHAHSRALGASNMTDKFFAAGVRINAMIISGGRWWQMTALTCVGALLNLSRLDLG
jgi:hypothetical protein